MWRDNDKTHSGKESAGLTSCQYMLRAANMLNAVAVLPSETVTSIANSLSLSKSAAESAGPAQGPLQVICKQGRLLNQTSRVPQHCNGRSCRGCLLPSCKACRVAKVMVDF